MVNSDFSLFEEIQINRSIYQEQICLEMESSTPL